MGVIEVRTQYTETVVGVGYSEILLFHNDVSEVTVTLSFITFSRAKIQASCSSEDELRAGTATWIDWDQGVVTFDAQDVAFAPNGMRAVNEDTGTIKFEVRCNR